MTQLTIGTAQILANEYGLPVESVRSYHKDIFTDGIAIGDLFFKTGTAIKHARFVIEHYGLADEVSLGTVKNHTKDKKLYVVGTTENRKMAAFATLKECEVLIDLWKISDKARKTYYIHDTDGKFIEEVF